MADGEIRECSRALSNGCAAGTSYMQAEHIKTWLRGAEREEDLDMLTAKGAGNN